MTNQHATVIQWNNTGIMFVGPSGCGKSTLALELIEQGAFLVADDQVILNHENDRWLASCPAAIQNRLHIHGVGLLHLKSRNNIPVSHIFCSDRTASKISQPPELNIPIVTIDFMDASAKQFVVNSLTSFDTTRRIP